MSPHTWERGVQKNVTKCQIREVLNQIKGHKYEEKLIEYDAHTVKSMTLVSCKS